jgi:hypothetical protein
MAKQTLERLIDDLDGTEATSTVLIGLDGKTVSLDLNDKHDSELRITLNPYIEAARRVRGEPVRRRTVARTTGDRDRNQAIRKWALDSGVQLPTRGRIAGAVQAAFDAQDVPALYAATGLEMAVEPKRGRRRTATKFSERA